MSLRAGFAALVIAVGLGGAAMACDGPPPHLTASDEELVARSHRIVLVEISAFEAGPAGYNADHPLGAELSRFRARVLDTLAGSPADEIFVYGHPPLKVEDVAPGSIVHGTVEAYVDEINAHNITDFDGHRDLAFQSWEAHGQAQVGPDCLAHPTFVIGERYLVFEGSQHVRGYELIRRDDDWWLARVRGLIDKRSGG